MLSQFTTKPGIPPALQGRTSERPGFAEINGTSGRRPLRQRRNTGRRVNYYIILLFTLNLKHMLFRPPSRNPLGFEVDYDLQSVTFRTPWGIAVKARNDGFGRTVTELSDNNHRTSNLEPRTSNFEPRTSNLELRVPSAPRRRCWRNLRLLRSGLDSLFLCGVPVGAILLGGRQSPRRLY